MFSFNLKTILQSFHASLTRFFVSYNILDESISIYGRVNFMRQIPKNENVLGVRLTLIDLHGHNASGKPDVPPVWTSTNTEVLDVKPSADGMRADYLTKQLPGLTTVKVAAIFRGKTIEGQEDIEVVGSEPARMDFSGGVPHVVSSQVFQPVDPATASQ